MAAGGLPDLSSRLRIDTSELRDLGRAVGEQVKGALANPAVQAAGAAIGGALTSGFVSNFMQGPDKSRLVAQLGLPPAQAKQAGAAASAVYRAGFGEDFGQVNDAVRAVLQNIDRNLSGKELQGITGAALNLADVMDTDVGAVTRAVSQQLRTGLAGSAKEALDNITVGFQHGADKSQDLLDTFNEYGTQFRKLGLSGKQATGLLSQGLQAGARDADIVADALKEFAIRTQENLEQTDAKGRVNMTALGAAFTNVLPPTMDMYEAQEQLAKGGDGARKTLGLMLDGLRNIKDPTDRAKTAVALFGTQAEDMGAALYALDTDTAAQGLGKVAGATDRMGAALADNGVSKIETFKRSLQGWTQDLAAATGPVGTVIGAVGGFGLAAASSIAPLAQLANATSLAALKTTALAVGQKVAAAASAAWTGVQWLLNAALSANPIGLVVIAIAALVAGVILAWKHSETFRTIVLAVWAAVSGAVMTAVRTVGTWIGNLVGWLRDAWAAIRSATTGAWDAVLGTVRDKAGALRDFVAGLPGRIGAALGGLATAVTAPGREAFQALRDAVGDKVGDLLDFVRGIPDRVLGAMGKVNSLLANAGRELIQGLIDGILSKLGAIGDAMGKVADKVKGFLPGSPVREGPLTSWNQGGAGKRLAGLLADGLYASVPAVGAAAAAVAAAAGLTAGVGLTGAAGAAGGGVGVGGGTSWAPTVQVQGVFADPDAAAQAAMDRLTWEALMQGATL